MKTLHLASVALAALLVSACEGDSRPFEEAVEIRGLNIASLSVIGPESTVDELVLNIDESVEFGVQGTNTASQIVELSASGRQWHVTNDEVAVIDEDGRLVAQGNGEVGVFVTIGGLDSNTFTLRVSDANLVGVDRILGDLSVDRCIPADYQARGAYDDGTIRDLTAVAWSLATADDGFASITSSPDINATLIGLNSGTVTLTATAGASSLPIDVAIADTLRSIVITPGSTTVDIDDTQLFVATGLYSDSATDEEADTSRVNITESVNWQISDTDVATVSNIDDTRGQVTGVEEGSATLNASCGELTAANPAIITVEESDSDGLSFNYGTFYTLSADSSGVYLRVSTGSSYSSSEGLDNDDLEWEMSTDESADPIDLGDDGDDAGFIRPLLNSGEATVTVTDSDGNTASIDIEVVDN